MRAFPRLLAITAITMSCDAPQMSHDAPQVIPTIQRGDYLLVIGQVKICPDLGEYVVEYAQVEDTEVTLLGHKIPVVGFSLVHVQKELIWAIEEETGRESVGLVIESIEREEFNIRQSELDEEIDLFYKSIEQCKRDIELFLERSKSVASDMYNKSFNTDASDAGAG